jgi:hypothetical protein
MADRARYLEFGHGSSIGELAAGKTKLKTSPALSAGDVFLFRRASVAPDGVGILDSRVVVIAKASVFVAMALVEIRIAHLGTPNPAIAVDRVPVANVTDDV